MTKGERLIWELFLMVKELTPVTEASTTRFTEWAKIFHEMEHPVPPPVPEHEQPLNPVEEHDEVDDEPPHQAPGKHRRKR